MKTLKEIRSLGVRQELDALFEQANALFEAMDSTNVPLTSFVQRIHELERLMDIGKKALELIAKLSKESERAYHFSRFTSIMDKIQASVDRLRSSIKSS